MAHRKIKWTADSWKRCKVLQQPDYPDQESYRAILQKIRHYPPLVSVGEVERLKSQIASAAACQAFILQGGDCAERFIDCNARMIANKLKILLQMSVILTYGIRMPIVKIGRIAGQYAKPRSKTYERVNGVEIPSYRGDSVNSFKPDPSARIADPERLLLSYYHSSITLNYIRAMIDGGFADLHHPYHWNLHSIEQTEKWPAYKDVLDRILDAVNFMEAFGGARPESLGKVDFFISHEGLLLDYEEALTRKDPQTGRHYNLGAHTLWNGERTRAIDGAHVEYFRGIANPIGVKIGPTCEADELLELLNRLNPEIEPGRIILI
ncbi:MAG: 3-deoxy-7-phosphoheptulonate synthase, partial [bacterium]